MSESKITLSVIVIVKDEEALITRCLKSVVGLADEILVIHDGPCSDRTLEIAQTFGAKISIGPFWGYMEPHLVPAYEQARGEWLMRLDADEYLSEEMRNALPRLMSDPNVSAYMFDWPLYDGEKYLSKHWPEKVCLFRKKDISFISIPDAPTIVHGSTKRVPYRLEHQPLKDNYAFKTFSTRWLRLARIRADLYTSPFRENILQYRSNLQDWPKTFQWRCRWPLLILPIDCLAVAIRVIRYGWKEGFIAWRVALMNIGLRAAIDWYLFKNKKA